ncbi:hypothetical protein JAU75_08250 [Ochrobactrum sp. Q0168]|uniref:hypothetical protein n=1 Tax=Ochrobactrum sp. Q0168 TaxID=2793241 RepID=UPI0018EC7C9E|nr:hypothetical protein [Ochrobactrum sp. Q0168]
MKFILIAAAVSVAFVSGAGASAPVTTKEPVQTSASKPDTNATIIAVGGQRTNGRVLLGGRSAFGG